MSPYPSEYQTDGSRLLSDSISALHCEAFDSTAQEWQRVTVPQSNWPEIGLTLPLLNGDDGKTALSARVLAAKSAVLSMARGWSEGSKTFLPPSRSCFVKVARLLDEGDAETLEREVAVGRPAQRPASVQQPTGAQNLVGGHMLEASIQSAFAAALDRCEAEWLRDNADCNNPNLPADRQQKCHDVCPRYGERGYENALAVALDGCLRAEAAKEGTGTCSVSRPATAEFTTAAELEVANSECTKSCKSKASDERKKAESRADAIRKAEVAVRNYRLCMVSARNTEPKLVRSESSLDAEYWEKARSRCRKQYGCDEIEAASNGYCSSDYDQGLYR